MTAKRPSKTERLKLLSEFTNCVPSTLYLEDAAAAIESSSLGDKVWYLRCTSDQADDRYSLGERIITSSELKRIIAEFKDKKDYVLQEYVEPFISGAAYISEAILVEAVHGQCDPLLRYGATGYRFGISHVGEILWTNFEGNGNFDIVRAFVRYVVELTKDDKTTKFLKGAILEWIVDPKERFYLVDYKKPGIAFLRSSFVKSPESFHIYRPSSSNIRLPKTSIEYLDSIEHSPEGLIFSSGSPLAHICVEAFYRKTPVSIPNCSI